MGDGRRPRRLDPVLLTPALTGALKERDGTRDPQATPQWSRSLPADLGHPGNDAVRRRLAMWERERSGAVLVAENDARPVAAVPYLEREGRCGRVVALVTSAECRERGIVRRLIEAAERVAADLGRVRMEVTSARHRAKSDPFHRSLGYVAASATSRTFPRVCFVDLG
ncbi:GNAT family N-acetyltransferase [Actinoallomurus acaciae]|uniref:GNAT family N-acetyltransferase n=1 Tax=Actinoallomurus acaciae TaxID=502577 RepID=A0ABV5Z111_9ACTN